MYIGCNGHLKHPECFFFSSSSFFSILKLILFYTIFELFWKIDNCRKRKKCLYPFQGHYRWLSVNSCIWNKKKNCYFQYNPCLVFFLSFPFFRDRRWTIYSEGTFSVHFSICVAAVERWTFSSELVSTPVNPPATLTSWAFAIPACLSSPRKLLGMDHECRLWLVYWEQSAATVCGYCPSVLLTGA